MNGEKYEFSEIPKLQDTVEYSRKIEEQSIRTQILEKLYRIKDEINDMTENVKNESWLGDNKQEEIDALNNKVKKLEDQIRDLI